MPDTWALNQRYPFLAINNWDSEYERVHLGGLTCDSEDFYNAEVHSNAIFLPKMQHGRDQYIGFFHMMRSSRHTIANMSSKACFISL